MIGGPVKNPILNIDNEEIVKRHLFALIFSMFQQERIAEQRNPNIFSTLGTVKDFRSGGVDDFSYLGLEKWLTDERKNVLAALKTVLDGNDAFTNEWIESVPQQLLDALKEKKLDFTEKVNEEENDEESDDESIETEDSPRDVGKFSSL
jgi:hypothetical protein